MLRVMMVIMLSRPSVMSFARPWSTSWSAQETRSTQTMTRRPGTMTGRYIAQPVMDVS
jgi:hypothetical protein